MDEALQIIAYRRDKLQAKNEYIKALEVTATALGCALLVTMMALIYLLY